MVRMYVRSQNSTPDVVVVVVVPSLFTVSQCSGEMCFVNNNLKKTGKDKVVEVIVLGTDVHLHLERSKATYNKYICL